MKKAILTPTAEHLEIDRIKLGKHPKDGKREFPDGEVFVQIPEVENLEEAVLIHSGMPEPNRGLMYLYNALKILKQNEIKTQVVFTYFPYGMQDKEFYKGCLNSARHIIDKLTKYYGVEKIYIFEPHFKNAEWLSNYQVESLDVMKAVKSKTDTDSEFLAPDEGAGDRFGVKNFKKDRKNSRDVKIEGEIKNAESIVVIDDIIETGGTMQEIAKVLRSQYVESIEAAAIHGVMEEGIEKTARAYDNLYLTNTIKNKHSNIKIEPVLREELELE
jgi:ribose-phosphate pyrophosphokinase